MLKTEKIRQNNLFFKTPQKLLQQIKIIRVDQLRISNYNWIKSLDLDDINF